MKEGPCELCGRQGALVKAIIEDAEFETCQPCGSYGRILNPPSQVLVKKSSTPVDENIPIIVENAGKRIRNAREKAGYSLREFANKIREKESLLQKVETNSIPLGIELAKKLERSLHIRLIEQVKEEDLAVKTEGSSAGGFTIGDKIKIK